jgi:hypothetical protein
MMRLALFLRVEHHLADLDFHRSALAETDNESQEYPIAMPKAPATARRSKAIFNDNIRVALYATHLLRMRYRHSVLLNIM